jgi:alkylated DNA repair dioxygenase AlkB
MRAQPEGLILVPSFITAAEESALVKELLRKDAPWLDKSHLKFSNTYQQEYGVCVSDAMEVVEGGESLPLPPLCMKLAVRVAKEAAKQGLIESEFASQGIAFLRVNHYKAAGGGYMHKHMDSKKCFGPVIACCSLLADVAMTFYDTKGNSFGMARVHDTAEVSIPRRSLYFMSGPSRSQWQHGIRKDQCPKERLSLTFRTVRKDAPCTNSGGKRSTVSQAKSKPSLQRSVKAGNKVPKKSAKS